MNRVLIIFGTRPEAIKMAPLVLRLRGARNFQAKVAVTAQHREMLDQVLELFAIIPDYDLDLMTPDQDLFDITIRVLEGLKDLLRQEQPDLVLVHGDTTTTFAAALAAYYLRIPVGHVEAGLRTRDKYRPYPEELNRRLACALSDYHFAPTEWARDNLLAEAVPPERIWVTGNTVIDALYLISAQVRKEQNSWEQFFRDHFNLSLQGERIILVTGHRRENFGAGFENICLALCDLVERYPDVHLIYPVHLNPNVQQPVYRILSQVSGQIETGGGVASVRAAGGGRLSLLPPLEYTPFVFLMNQSYLVLTDSGGIQEEAPALGKPVLVMRDVTERPEGVWAGTVKLVGASRECIVRETIELFENPVSYQAMTQAQNPYGDGRASQRIVNILNRQFTTPQSRVFDPELDAD
jgi:UDP-N-acetylglucosamine 2-epimerase (non-hydrolysing)